MRKTLGLFWAFLFILSACQSQETALRQPESESPKKRGVTVLFSSNRQLEIEPCGCSLNPAGGIEREFNYFTAVKAEVGHPVIGLASGATFVPEAADFQPKSLGFYQKKAIYAVKGMNALELKALAPSADDFRLGVEYLKQLESKSTFPWVLANVVDKKTKQPVFKPTHSFKVGDDEYLVIGLTGPAQKVFANKNIQVLPAEEVLRGILSEVKTRKFVIVMSNLPRAEWQKMSALTSKIQLILGSTDADSTGAAWEQWTPGTLFANPPHRSQFMARLDLAWVEPITGFYGASFVEAAAFSRRALQMQITEANLILEKKLSKKEKKKWTDRATAASEKLGRLVEVPTALAPGLAEAKSQIHEIGNKYKDPQNPSSELLAQWQAELRELAIKK